MQKLHCPNPVCTHTFSAVEVQRLGSLTCPECGQVFQFRAPPKPARPKDYPIAAPATQRPAATPAVSKPQVANPVAPTNWLEAPAKPINTKPVEAKPVASRSSTQPWPMPSVTEPAASVPATFTPVAAGELPADIIPGTPASPPALTAAPAPPLEPGEKLVRYRGMAGMRSRHPVLKAAIVFMVIALFLGGIVIAITRFENWLDLSGARSGGGPQASLGLVFSARTLSGKDEKVFAVNLDKEVWSADNKDLLPKLKARAVYRRIDGQAEGWFAFAVQDFGLQSPREGELVDGALERLDRVFGDTLQADTRKLEPSQLAERNGMRFAYKGTTGSVVWWGECHLIAFNGFAYWLFFTAPTLEEVHAFQEEFDAQRVLTFLTDRRGWTEQPPEHDVFTSKDRVLTIKAPAGVWKRYDPETYDPANGVLFLSGLFLRQPDNTKNALLFGIGLPRVREPKEAYKEMRVYLENQKKEEAKEYYFAPADDSDHLNGEPQDVGNSAGYVGQLKVMRGNQPMRYIHLAVANGPAKTYGFRFECAWAHRSIWRREFQDLQKSIQIMTPP